MYSFGNFHLSFGRLPQSHHINFCQVSYSVFRIAQNVLLGIDILYVRVILILFKIRIDGIVPKECGLNLIEASLELSYIVTKISFFFLFNFQGFSGHCISSQRHQNHEEKDMKHSFVLLIHLFACFFVFVFFALKNVVSQVHPSCIVV